MELQVTKVTGGSPTSIPAQVGGGETILAVNGLMDAIQATEALFSEGAPDTVYRAALQAVSALKRIVSQSRDTLEECDLRLQILEKRVMTL